MSVDWFVLRHVEPTPAPRHDDPQSTDFLLLCVVISVAVVACSARPQQISNSRTGAYEAALVRVGEGFAAAWYDTRDGNAEIYLRMLDRDGRPSGPERRLTNGPEDSYEASIDRLGDGLAVAWYDQTGKDQHVAKLGLFNQDGSPRWMGTLAEGGRNPAIATGGRAIFCAWIQRDPRGEESVLAGWWETDGRPRAAPMRLGPASATTWNLNVDVDETGVGWVVFDASVATRASEVYVVRADSAGISLTRLTEDDGASSTYPDLAIGPGGRAALTWYDERDGNTEVYLLTGRLLDLTAEIDHRARRVTTTPGESIGAYVAWNGDRLGLAWSDKIAEQHEIHFQSFDAAGAPLGPARRLTENRTRSLVPAIQPWRDGFALLWNEFAPASTKVHDGASEISFMAVGGS